MGVTRAYAEAEVARFNDWIVTQEQGTRSMFGDRLSSIKTYERCQCGAPYTAMREYKAGDCPDGVTIGPILLEDEP